MPSSRGMDVGTSSGTLRRWQGLTLGNVQLMPQGLWTCSPILCRTCLHLLATDYLLGVPQSWAQKPSTCTLHGLSVTIPKDSLPIQPTRQGLYSLAPGFPTTVPGA